jgi:N-acetyl-1-D-myo-inositol-2-amino-2-deoxy-alpha-D-glucopyranoside deacetylase
VNGGPRRRLAAFVAHPDDDTFGVTGTAAKHAEDPEFRLTLALVTSGERGEIADPRLATPQNLGEVREREDRASWRALGRVPDRHEFLRYPDGALADIDLEGLVSRIAMILREERPDVVVTFGPDGITGHTDHIRVGEATTEAFHRVRAEGAGDGFRRLLYNCLPASRLAWFNSQLEAWGFPAMDPTQPFQPRGVDDAVIAIDVNCTPIWRRKLDALREHKTQAQDIQLPEELTQQVLSWETYAIAWPPRGPHAGLLGGVFDGLD